MRTAYLEINEKPDTVIKSESGTYRITAFSSRVESMVGFKLRELMALGYEPVAVKFENKFFIYVKVPDDVPTTTSEVSDPASGEDSGSSESVSEEAK